jgi:hypothetical protein
MYSLESLIANGSSGHGSGLPREPSDSIDVALVSGGSGLHLGKFRRPPWPVGHGRCFVCCLETSYLMPVITAS